MNRGRPLPTDKPESAGSQGVVQALRNFGGRLWRWIANRAGLRHRPNPELDAHLHDHTRRSEDNDSIPASMRGISSRPQYGYAYQLNSRRLGSVAQNMFGDRGAFHRVASRSSWSYIARIWLPLSPLSSRTRYAEGPFASIRKIAVRLSGATQNLPRRAPMSFAYICLLVAGHFCVKYGMSTERADALYRHVSTNLDNLADHPLTAMFGSMLFFEGTLTNVLSLEFLGTFFTLILGVCFMLPWAEIRFGRMRAAAIFVGAHVGSTLLTAKFISVALKRKWYAAEVRREVDYGVSYGSQAVMAVGVLAFPRWARIPWGIFVAGWPLLRFEWLRRVPDFTTIGHLLPVIFGFGLAATRSIRGIGRGLPTRMLGAESV
ncbi:rhomboid-like protein [Actinoplanes sp. NPDC051859]|uniref:rhomboid-like protein n=1 Tax=Actinoplanes sp. NPDC051859 TaxID=3363909 RepID=UPI0037AED3FF